MGGEGEEDWAGEEIGLQGSEEVLWVNSGVLEQVGGLEDLDVSCADLLEDSQIGVVQLKIVLEIGDFVVKNS